jgi:mycofactocin glycosyltransferase
MSGAARFELDAGVRVRDRGRLLVGGTPPRLVRLSEAGARALDEILAAEGAEEVVVAERPTDPDHRGRPLARCRGQRTTAGGAGGTAEAGGAAALARRLERGGLLHPLPGDGADDPPVTAIVPVLDGGEGLAGLVTTLAAEGPVIIIDDGSRDGSGARAAAAGARVLRHPSPRGPAAARNAGLAAAETELVAFLDADCEVVPGWRRGLAGLFAADPDLALVAPRVRSAPGNSPLARYEETGSPLDLGPAASLVGPERRVTYLPAAALLGRRDALLALGGFDEAMRFGEDVDLVWRLGAAGHRLRYVPSRAVAHRPRPDLAGFARQRAGYGSSAVELVRRHGSAAAPLRPGRHSVAIWTAGALLGPRALLPALAASTAVVACRGSERRSREALAELALRGQAGAATHLARVALREWLPLGLAAAPFSRRARAALLAAFLVDSAPLWSRAEQPAELPRATALHLLDRSAYAAGMWREMARRRDFRALLPRATRARCGAWPKVAHGRVPTP